LNTRSGRKESDVDKQKGFFQRHLPQKIIQLSSQKDIEKEIIYSETGDNCQEGKGLFILIC
jgi:hypothetical protein